MNPTPETLRTLQPRPKLVQLSIGEESNLLVQENAPKLSAVEVESLEESNQQLVQHADHNELKRPARSHPPMHSMAGPLRSQMEQQQDLLNSPVLQQMIKLIHENAELKAQLRIQEMENKFRNELAEVRREQRQDKSERPSNSDEAVLDHLQKAIETLQDENEDLTQQVDEYKALARQTEEAFNKATEQCLQLVKEVNRLRVINDKLRGEVAEAAHAHESKEKEDREDGEKNERNRSGERDKKNRDQGKHKDDNTSAKDTLSDDQHESHDDESDEDES